MKMAGQLLLYGLIGLLAFALPAPAADISGQWHAEFDTLMGVQKYHFDFHVQDEKVTARAVAETGDQKRDVQFQEATLEGDTLTFVEIRQIQGREIRIEFTGKVGDNGIKFTRSVGDFGSQQSEATRIAATPSASAAANAECAGGRSSAWRSRAWRFWRSR